MSVLIFDKTEKGCEEITSRKYHVPPRLRTLLLLANGKHTGEELLKKVAGIGLDDQSLAELVDSGFLFGTPQDEPAAPSQVSPPEPAAQPAAQPSAGQESMANDSDKGQSTDQAQFEAVYQFYTETITPMLGLRGFGLQLKVEKAASFDDLRALRQPYLDGIFKAKGKEITRSVQERLDRLLSPDAMRNRGRKTSQP